MSAFASSAFAVAAFSVAAFSFDAGTPVTPEVPPSGGGGGGWSSFSYPAPKEIDHQQLKLVAQQHAEDEIIFTLIVNAVTNNLLDG